MKLLGNVGRGLASGRPLDHEDLERATVPASGLALPPLCLRSLQSPRPECGANCPGHQRDGSCLADHARQAFLDGKLLTFEIDSEGYWVPTW